MLNITKPSYAMWQANKDVSRCLHYLSEDMPDYRRAAYMTELKGLIGKQKAIIVLAGK